MITFAWDNKADAAIITAGSQLATLPGSNVQTPLLVEPWGTAAGVKNSFLVFDMGAAVTLQILAVLGTNLTSAATYRLRSSNADPNVTGAVLYDSTLLAAGVKTGYGAIYKTIVGAAAARYWRLDLADATVADNLQIGRVFLGPYWQPAAGQLWDWSVASIDDSELSQTYGLQVHADELPKRRQIEFMLDFMSEDEAYGSVFAMAVAKGRTRDILVVPNLAGTYLSEQSVWGLCEAMPPIRNRLPRIYATQKFIVKERAVNA
jgi:hypothetical protein